MYKLHTCLTTRNIFKSDVKTYFKRVNRHYKFNFFIGIKKNSFAEIMIAIKTRGIYYLLIFFLYLKTIHDNIQTRNIQNTQTQTLY